MANYSDLFNINSSNIDFVYNADDTFPFSFSSTYLHTSIPAPSYASDFTLEFIVKYNSLRTDPKSYINVIAAADNFGSNNYYWKLVHRKTSESDSTLVFVDGIIEGFTSHYFGQALTLGVKHHVAISRYNGVLKGFIDGIECFSVNKTGTIASLGNLILGSGFNTDTTRCMDGFIYAFRSQKTSIYKTDFTPPLVLH